MNIDEKINIMRYGMLFYHSVCLSQSPMPKLLLKGMIIMETSTKFFPAGHKGDLSPRPPFGCVSAFCFVSARHLNLKGGGRPSPSLIDFTQLPLDLEISAPFT